jgi:hypothetical protein
VNQTNDGGLVRNLRKGTIGGVLGGNMDVPMGEDDPEVIESMSDVQVSNRERELPTYPIYV